MHQQTNDDTAAPIQRAERIMKPWGIPTATGGHRVDMHARSGATLVLEVTQVHDRKETKASTPMSRDSARALRDALSVFLGDQ